MKEAVPAAAASHRFSELLRAVQRGRSVLVTSHDRPVARIVPAAGDDRTQATAQAILLNRLRRERVVTVGFWRRDGLYEVVS